MNLSFFIFRNVKPEVHRVSSAWRNKMCIDSSARRPCIPTGDGVPVLVDQQRAIEMRAGIDRPVPIVPDAAAPENDAPLIIGGLEREPAIECIHGTAREEVAELHRAQYDVNTYRVAGANRRIHAVEWRTYWLRRRARGLRGRRSHGLFLADGEGGLNFRLSQVQLRF